MDDEQPKKARFSRRRAERDLTRVEYGIARAPAEAHDACAIAEEWLAELGQMAWLDHESEHAVHQALRNIRAARKFLEKVVRESR
jgi:hypothetical protein